jgi:hypothetical protein
MSKTSITQIQELEQENYCVRLLIYQDTELSEIHAFHHPTFPSVQNDKYAILSDNCQSQYVVDLVEIVRYYTAILIYDQGHKSVS